MSCPHPLTREQLTVASSFLGCVVCSAPRLGAPQISSADVRHVTHSGPITSYQFHRASTFIAQKVTERVDTECTVHGQTRETCMDFP